MKNKLYFFSLSGTLAVLLGAFSSHYLKTLVQQGLCEPSTLESFKTGVLYHLTHTLQLGMLLFINDKNPGKGLRFSMLFSQLGILLFSGSIYVITFLKISGIGFYKFLGPITPVGGIFLILSWFTLFLHFFHGSGKKFEN